MKAIPSSWLCITTGNNSGRRVGSWKAAGARHRGLLCAQATLPSGDVLANISNKRIYSTTKDSKEGLIRPVMTDSISPGLALLNQSKKALSRSLRLSGKHRFTPVVHPDNQLCRFRFPSPCSHLLWLSDHLPSI